MHTNTQTHTTSVKCVTLIYQADRSLSSDQRKKWSFSSRAWADHLSWTLLTETSLCNALVLSVLVPEPVWEHPYVLKFTLRNECEEGDDLVVIQWSDVSCACLAVGKTEAWWLPDAATDECVLKSSCVCLMLYIHTLLLCVVSWSQTLLTFFVGFQGSWYSHVLLRHM